MTMDADTARKALFKMKEPLKDAVGLARGIKMVADGISDESDQGSMSTLAERLIKAVQLIKEYWDEGTKL